MPHQSGSVLLTLLLTMLRPSLTFLLLTLLTLGATPALGQGRIAGTVTDAQTGEALIGVNVIIAGTSQGAATNPDGEFEITGLRADAYNIRVSYIGYESKLFTGIEVTSGETTRLDVELEEAVLSTDQEVVVVGERPLIDVEQSTSTTSVSREEIEAAPLRDIQDVVSTQVGVMQDPTGLYIRGGRADETGYIVDGVSAKDPLAGTGFGLDIGSNAFSEVEVTTGGIGAEHGNVTSGVVSVQTREGGNQFSGFFSHKRDNFGFNDDWDSNYREDLYEFNLGGPILRDKLTFFVSGQAQLSDGFTRHTANPDSIRSSLVGADYLLPRTGNRWNGLAKLTYQIRPGMKLQGSYQRSLTVNQNTRMLQVTGNEAVINPGFQYAFILQPENANTYAHDNIITYLKWSHVLDDRSFYEVQASRLFTEMRADANGRRWRPETVDSELDPESIVTYPADLFVDESGRPLDPNSLFVLPGPGLYNNEGIATRFHDHYAEELTLRATYTRFSAGQNHRFDAGLETKFNDYQWIDIIRPWVGAPVGTGDEAGQTNRLGESSDIWQVEPRRGALFATQQIRYRGLIANLGARLEYWAAGEYVDDLVAQRLEHADVQAERDEILAENPDTPASELPALPTLPPILESVAQNYQDETTEVFGLRYKFRLLPKVRVSFPIRENQVLFFNYGHSTKMPHPTFVYSGLDPFYQDRSFFADLGNPSLDPEVDISYELGLRNQLTSNDALTITAFWRDKFDFITVTDVIVPDPTGRETTRAFRINGDFARVRGLEASYFKRIGDWFRGQVSGSFSRATGLNSTNSEALADYLADGDIDNTFETPLAWDRPLDLKASVTFMHDREEPLLGVPGLNRFRVHVASNFRSGRRYTPVTFEGRQVNPFTGERDWRPVYETVSDPAARYSEVGEPWWWFDLTLQRSFRVGPSDLQVTLEITNLFDQLNSVIVNPVTGEAYPDESPSFVANNREALRDDEAYDVPISMRDPRYEDPTTGGLPPFNPARYMPQRHVMLGLAYRF